MPTSTYSAAVTVEIAFNAGFGTPAASRVWTDVSDYVELDEGITITVGRSDERSTADANVATLTLDNKDGRFTPGRASSPYFPNVKLYRPIRIKATPVDGSETVRFLGYINEWPLEWAGTDGYAKVSLSASSRLARLALTTGLRSIVEETILSDSPNAYYTMGEPVGAAQANDSSGRQGSPLAVAGLGASVTFGSATGPGTDSLTAAQFAGGQYLRGSGSSFLSASSTFTVEAFFLVNTGSFGAILETRHSNGFVSLEVLADGRVGFDATNTPTAASVISTNSYADGATHHVAGVSAAGTLTLYIDGAAVATTTGGPTLNACTSATVANFTTEAFPLTGVVSHAAWFDTALSPARVAAHSDAGRTGFAGELTSARLARYAALANISSTEVSSETGQTTMAHVDTTDQQVVEMMRKVETTEGGFLFDARDGTLTMQNRAHRYLSTAAYTLTMSGKHEVEANYNPKLDPTGLLNDVTASNYAGTVTARVVDTTSRNDYGMATTSVETDSADTSEPNLLASWLVNQFKDPKERTPNLGVNALGQVGKTPNCAAIMATNLGDKITVAGRPSQASSSSIDYFVEGYTETYGPESLTFVFNVSPSSPYDQVFVLNNATRGVLDTSILAF